MTDGRSGVPTGQVPSAPSGPGRLALRLPAILLLVAALLPPPSLGEEPPPLLGPLFETVAVENPGEAPPPAKSGKGVIPLRALWKAETEFRSGDPSHALSRFLDLAYNFSDDERKGFVWMRVGELLLARKDLKQALEAADRAVALSEGRFLVLSSMDLKLRIYQRLGWGSEARQVAGYLLAQDYINADPADLLAAMARADGDSGKVALALSEYRRAIAATKGPVNALRLRVDRNSLIDGLKSIPAMWEAALSEDDPEVRARLFLRIGQTAARKGFVGMGIHALKESSRVGGVLGEEAARHLTRLEEQASSHPEIVGLVPLSGRYADIGFAVLSGAEVALRRRRTLEEDPLSPVVRWVDTGGEPDRARAQFLESSSDRSVIGFIGPLTGEEGHSVGVVFDPESPPVLYLGQKRIPQKPFLFNFGLTPRQEARAVLSHLARTGKADLVLLFPDTGYGRGFADAVVSAAGDAGVRVTRSVSYPPDTSDFTDVIRRAVGSAEFARLSARKEKGEERRPPPPRDAIVIADRWERVFLLASQLRFYNVYLPLAGFSGWNDQELLRKAGDAVSGSVFSVDYAGTVPGYLDETFRKEYRESMDRPPSRFEAMGYDAAHLLGDAYRLEAGKGIRSAGALTREGITLSKTLQGVTGSFQFGPAGDLRRKVTLLGVELGNFVPIPEQ